jgi:hypothetical protein
LHDNISGLSLLIESHYLPCIAYFSAISTGKTIIIERHEHYVKQTYRNRCHINASHGKEVLIIPITSKHNKVLITDVKIDYAQKWLNNHWRTIQSAYGKAPFFEYYSDELHEVLFRQQTFLYDLNIDLLTLCLKWLKWDVTIEESLAYEKTPGSTIYDLRSFLTPKNEDYTARIYKPVQYHQVFGNAFADNLSLIDLIFCSGPEAGRIVSSSHTGR